jgi:FKBP-type peptidyl-prolyl cis-trans isomerase
MKFYRVSLLVALAAAPLFAADSGLNLSDQTNKTSYALGVNFGQNLKNQGVSVNLDVLRKGIDDALAGQPQLNDQQMRETFAALRAQIQAHMTEKSKENKAAGDKFLAENASKPGITKTESGLQYRVIKEGSGESPKSNDEVEVKYTGKLIDGTVFDSTEKQGGKPARFRVNGVIKGWTEALEKMKKGAEWELFIPSEIAYGERGRPGIPPNSTLIFTVELLDIHPAPAAKTQGQAQQPVTSDIIKVPSAEELKKGAKIEVIKPQDVEKEIAKEKARKEAEEKNKK